MIKKPRSSGSGSGGGSWNWLSFSSLSPPRVLLTKSWNAPPFRANLPGCAGVWVSFFSGFATGLFFCGSGSPGWCSSGTLVNCVPTSASNLCTASSVWLIFSGSFSLRPFISNADFPAPGLKSGPSVCWPTNSANGSFFFLLGAPFRLELFFGAFWSLCCLFDELSWPFGDLDFWPFGFSFLSDCVLFKLDVESKRLIASRSALVPPLVPEANKGPSVWLLTNSENASFFFFLGRCSCATLRGRFSSTFGWPTIRVANFQFFFSVALVFSIVV